MAEYTTPEKLFGADFTDTVYARAPEASYDRVLTHLRELLPEVDETKLRKLLG